MWCDWIGTADGPAYSDMRRIRWIRSDDLAGSPVLKLRFVEAVVTDVRVEGQNLEDIRHWIIEGTMPWIWEQPLGFRTRDDRVVVIARMTISEIDR